MLQIRRIGRQSAVALTSPMRPITADAPVSDVRHQHRSYTNLLCVRGTSSFRMSLEWDLSVRRPASDRRWQSSARYARW